MIEHFHGGVTYGVHRILPSDFQIYGASCLLRPQDTIESICSESVDLPMKSRRAIIPPFAGRVLKNFRSVKGPPSDVRMTEQLSRFQPVEKMYDLCPGLLC